MHKIAFFCIPAHGHTNPTIEVVRRLTSLGHEVWYFSYLPFKEKIESAGAKFIACDSYDIQMNLRPEDSARVGKDIGFSIRLITNTILALDEMICRTLQEWNPDCVVADSMAVWGKFAALKLGIPFLSSTTTFAFNQHSAQVMDRSISQIFSLLKSMPGMKKDIRRLQAQGYPVKDVFSLIQNDNDTNTIVYTSKEFHPCSHTFSDKYVFVGPSVNDQDYGTKKTDRKTIYISMGTVNNRMPDFYSNCIKAFQDGRYDVIMSVGGDTDITRLGTLPKNFTVQHHVNQIAVLQKCDVFLSHCGMNSVNESLYYKVPLVLFPQTPEQGGVANRVMELQAGILLKKNRADAIRKAIDTVLLDKTFQVNAADISDSFKRAGGAHAAAEAILKIL